MFWLELKRGGAIVLIAINLVLLVWAIRAYRRKFTLADGYFKLLPFSPAVAVVQLILGVSFYASGVRPPLMHIFYGVLIGLGATGQVLVGPRTGLGQKYRAKPLVHAFLALFVALLSARSWMAARM